MPDTIRQLADLIALFPDNDLGLISAQDLRDFLVSSVPTGRGDTAVVAATGCTSKQKADADFVCDGTDDNVQLQAAIDAVAASGGRVRMAGPLFTLGARLNVNNSGVALIGDGRRLTTLKLADGANDNVIRIGSAAALNGPELRGFSIDGNILQQNDGASINERAGVWADGTVGGKINDLIAEDLYVTACRGPGMVLDGVSGSEIVRPSLRDVLLLANGVGGVNPVDGVHLGYAQDVQLERVSSQLNTDTGIALDYVTGAIETQCVCRGNTSNQFTVARQSKYVSILGGVADGLDLGGNYGIRTGKFGDVAAGLSQDLQIVGTRIINNGVGLHVEDHAILQATGLYCPGSGGDGNGAALAIMGTAAFLVFTNNIGIISQIAGASSVPSGSTSKVVTHGVNAVLAAALPIALRHVQITPNEHSTVGRLFAVTAVDSTTFTVTLSGDPGASGWDFSWQIRLDV